MHNFVCTKSLHIHRENRTTAAIEINRSNCMQRGRVMLNVRRNMKKNRFEPPRAARTSSWPSQKLRGCRNGGSRPEKPPARLGICARKLQLSNGPVAAVQRTAFEFLDSNRFRIGLANCSGNFQLHTCYLRFLFCVFIAAVWFMSARPL